ncbi:unnamed protein product [Peronospora effusa]|nr:unnamed protein product [Peronospora effusa]
MDFIFGLPPDEQKRTGVLMHQGLPESIVSDSDPRFTSTFWAELFQLLGTRLLMSTAAYPETDGQTERVNRVLEDVLRSYTTSFSSWSSFLPLAEFAINNAVHASAGLTFFFVSNARHPRVPALLAPSASEPYVSKLGGGVYTDRIAPKLLMIDFDEDKVAADAPTTGNFVANGISTPDAMLFIASHVANIAPKVNTSPVSSAAVTDSAIMTRNHAFCA